MLYNEKRTVVQQALEGTIAVAIVLLFFFIIMLVLNVLFPYGGMQLFSTYATNSAGTQGSSLRPSGAGLSTLNGNDPPLTVDDRVATLIELHNLVKSKHADDLTWEPAEVGMPLYSLDAIQTLDDSSAHIRFDPRNEIALGPNSLLVIRRVEQNLNFLEKRHFNVVIDGELRDRSADPKEGGRRVPHDSVDRLRQHKHEPAEKSHIQIDGYAQLTTLSPDSRANGQIERRSPATELGRTNTNPAAN